MKRIWRDSKGFTLVELMLAVALVGIFISTVYGFLNFNFRFLNAHNDEMIAELRCRMAMQRMTELLQRYETIEVTGTEVKGEDGQVLIDFAKMTGPRAALYYLDWDEVNQNGVLKNHQGDSFVADIQTLNFTQSDHLLKIDIEVLNLNHSQERPFTLITQIRLARHYQPG